MTIETVLELAMAGAFICGLALIALSVLVTVAMDYFEEREYIWSSDETEDV